MIFPLQSDTTNVINKRAAALLEQGQRLSPQSQPVKEALTVSDYQFNPDVEQWKEIPDFPGYEVSDQGRVRSYWRHRQAIIEPTPQRFMKPQVNHAGYLYVGINREGRRYVRPIHLLVLEIFVGFRPQGYQACHNDGKRTHNYSYNLRWDTPKNNQADRVKHGTKNMGANHGSAKLTAMEVDQIKYLAKHGYFQVEIGNMYGVWQTNISAILTGKTWKHI